MIEELKDIRQDICNKVSAYDSMLAIVMLSLPNDFVIKIEGKEDIDKTYLYEHFNECLQLIDKDLHRIDAVVKELKDIKSKIGD